MTQKQNAARSATITTKEGKKGIFSIISLPAVLAATLTSITSFLFSSKLGLTGSLAGAGIGSAVSAVASQVYNAMIGSSVEKMRDLTGRMQQRIDGPDAVASTLLKSDKTQKESLVIDLRDVEFTEDGMLAILPIESLTESKIVRSRRNPQFLRAFAVTTAAAMIALLCFGFAVHVATRGKGIGPTPESIQTCSQTVTSDQSDVDAAANKTTEQKSSDEDSKNETSAAELESGDGSSSNDTANTQQPSSSDQPADTTDTSESLGDGTQLSQEQSVADTTEVTDQGADTTSEVPSTGV